MAKFDVQGPDAAAVLGRLSTADVDREVGRVVYTQWLDTTRRHPGRPHRHAARPTSGSWSSPPTSSTAASAAMIRRETRAGEHVYVTDVTSGDGAAVRTGPALARAAAAAHARRPVRRGVPVPDRARRSSSTTRGCSRCGSRTSASSARSCTCRPSTRRRSTTRCMAAGADLGVAPVGLAAMGGLRLEKGYRDFGVDIDNTDDPLDGRPRLRRRVGQAGRLRRPRRAAGAARDAATADACDGVAARSRTRRSTLYGNEPLLVDGSWVGYVRAAGYGHTARRRGRARRRRPRRRRHRGVARRRRSSTSTARSTSSGARLACARSTTRRGRASFLTASLGRGNRPGAGGGGSMTVTVSPRRIAVVARVRGRAGRARRVPARLGPPAVATSPAAGVSADRTSGVVLTSAGSGAGTGASGTGITVVGTGTGPATGTVVVSFSVSAGGSTVSAAFATANSSMASVQKALRAAGARPRTCRPRTSPCSSGTRTRAS